MSAVPDIRSRLADKTAKAWGCSMDHPNTQKRFAQSHNLPFPLLADPKGEVADSYGIKDGSYAKRVTFVIDGEGKVLKVVEGKDAIDPRAALDACPLHKDKT